MRKNGFCKQGAPQLTPTWLLAFFRKTGYVLKWPCFSDKWKYNFLVGLFYLAISPGIDQAVLKFEEKEYL